MRGWRNLADAPDLGSGGEIHGGSNPPPRKFKFQIPSTKSQKNSKYKIKNKSQ